MLYSAAIMAICFLAFSGLTVWYVTYQVNHAEHAFCQLLNTLTQVQPPAGDPKANPSRAYTQEVEADLLNLRQKLGC